jgi:hypothetical protein
VGNLVAGDGHQGRNQHDRQLEKKLFHGFPWKTQIMCSLIF